MTVSETTQVIDHVANKLQVPTKELMSTLPQLGIHDLSLTVISAVVLLLSILSICYFYRCMAQAENEETHLAAEFRHMELIRPTLQSALADACSFLRVSFSDQA